MVVRTAEGIDGGLPMALKHRMRFNVALDFAVGLVPFLGDVADAIYKCNTRNAILLERHLRTRGKKNLEHAGRTPPTDDPSLADEFDRTEAQLDEQHGGPSPRYDDRAHARAGNGASQPARAQTDGGRGYFGGSRKERNRDVEMEEGRAPAQPHRR